MILIAKTYWAGAPFSFRRRPEGAAVESLELRADDFRRFRALYWTPAGEPRPKVAVVCMHPRADFTHHYAFPRLLAAGVGCLGACTRNPNNDTTTVHEEIVLDVAACLQFLRTRRGVERVVLLGNSGGGALFGMYQAQANLPPGERIARSPAGESTRLRVAEMSPADGMIFVAAHRGEGKVMNECIDPSVVDEHAPLVTDPELDMYDPRNGFRPAPEWGEYDAAFVARYREAQLARVRRLDALAHALVDDARRARARTEDPGFAELREDAQLADRRRAAFQPVMVVYRTMANLHYVDRHLDPSDREYGSLLSDRPDLMNFQLLGFGRMCTPHAWLSTWSGLSSNADLVRCLAGIPQPTLVVHAGRDREIYPRTDAREISGAVVAEDRTVIEMPEARHYFEPDFGQQEAPQVEALMDRVVPWIEERFRW